MIALKSIYGFAAFLNESGDQGCVGMDMPEQLSVQSLPVSLLARRLVGPHGHLILGASFWSLARGGTDLERGYGDVRPWRPPFHASPVARKGPISSKRVSSQDPLLRKLGNFSLYSLNFHPNFSSQAPKFGNFQLTSPQIWKFSAHKPPNLEIFRSQAPPFQRQMSVRKPHTSEIRAAHPYLKKSWVPPPPGVTSVLANNTHC